MAKFNGSDYKPARDKKRLTSGMNRVLAVMQDGQRRTVQEIKAAILKRFGVEDLENSISAQVRNLRKPENGDHNVPDAERRADGLYEYHLSSEPKHGSAAPEPVMPDGLFPSDGQPQTGMM